MFGAGDAAAGLLGGDASSMGEGVAPTAGSLVPPAMTPPEEVCANVLTLSPRAGPCRTYTDMFELARSWPGRLPGRGRVRRRLVRPGRPGQKSDTAEAGTTVCPGRPSGVTTPPRVGGFGAGTHPRTAPRRSTSTGLPRQTPESSRGQEWSARHGRGAATRGGRARARLVHRLMGMLTVELGEDLLC